MPWMTKSDRVDVREKGRGEHGRAQRSRAKAALLESKAKELTEAVQQSQRRNTALRDWSATLRSTRPVLLWAGGTPVRWIRVEGDLWGRPVWAWWRGGQLSGDRRLLERARLMVEMDTVFRNDDPPAVVRATLDGPPAAIMLTLARACEHVTSVEFETVKD